VAEKNDIEFASLLKTDEARTLRGRPAYREATVIIMAALTTLMTGHYVLLLTLLSSSFFQRVILEVPPPIAAKLSHIIGSECNLRNWVTNLKAPPLKIWGSKS